MIRIAFHRTGFSLVELSIVLVILGLLVGGILAGQSLIRASELRAVGTEYTRYQTAMHAFKDKYFAIPGDMANATSFWGKDNAKCSTHSGTTATPGTCNGNGDGQIGYASGSPEMFRMWQHLALAGLIEGIYTGVSADGSSTDNGANSGNSPTSKYNNALWGVDYSASAPSSAYFNVFYGNFLQVGGYYDTTNMPITKIFSSQDLWNIDTKIDDGRPGAGKMLIWRYYDCATGSGQNDTNVVYNLNTTNLCNPLFRQII